MREIDLGFGVAGWLLVILLIYTIIKNHRSIYEFILDHYGTIEVSEELLKLYKKYYDKKLGHWRHDP